MHTTAVVASPLPAPTVTATFERVHALTGKLVGCLSPEATSACTGEKYFRITEILAPTINVHWTYPPTSTSVYAKTTVTATPLAKLDLLPTPVNVVHSGSGGVGTASLSFSDEAQQYCADLVTVDLKTDATTDTQTVCVQGSGSPVTELTPLLDAELLGCTAPPNEPSLLEKWCGLHTGAQQCAALDAGIDASLAGAGGSAGVTGAAGAMPVGGAASNAGEPGSSGCSATPASSPSLPAILTLLASAGLALRRRR